MEFFEVIGQRHSFRAFDGRPVEPEKLQKVLETANGAPSAGNRQSYAIYIVKDVRRRAALAKAACGQGHVLAAPVCLVFCADPARAEEEYGARGAKLYSVQDATIACAFAMLAATALGLATVWTGAFDEDAVRRVLRAPEDIVPVSILPLGYSSAAPEIRERRPLEDLVHAVP